MKISNREKVILGITAVAAIWAGSNFLLSGGGKAPTETKDEITQEAVVEAAQSLALNSLTETEQAIWEKAETAWPADPFLKNSITLAKNEQTVTVFGGGQFIFSGYIETGDVKLAIVNGDEYAPGDRIAGTSFWVRSISQHQVLLAAPDNSIVTVPMVTYPGSNSAAAIKQSE